jgi:hypothetical protein
MKLLSFCVLTTLALVYAGLTIGETVTYRRWEQALNDQKDVQAKMTYFQNLSHVLDSLMHRMAVDSLRDPALAQMLKDHKIKVVVKGAQAAGGAPAVDAGSSSAPLPAPLPVPSPAPPQPSAPSPTTATTPHP